MSGSIFSVRRVLLRDAYRAEELRGRRASVFTTGPARVLGIERKIAADEPADLTIFSLDLA